MNADAVARGLFVSSSYRTHKDEEKRNQSTLEEERFCKPEKYYPNGTIMTRSMKHGNYDKLNDDGFIKEGSKVQGGDIIIGKIVPIKGAGPDEPRYKDSSIALKEDDEGTADKVYTDKNGEGYKFCKVRVRTDRTILIGDKFCLTPDHDVLTKKRGWVKINELSMEDEIATLVDGKYLKYEKPIELQEFDHKGKMYDVNDGDINLCVTPNHKMYIKKDGE